MIPVVVARFPEEPDPELLNIKRFPRNEGDVQKAVSIAAFLTLAEIFDPTIPCIGGAQRNASFPLLETEGLSLLKQYANIEGDSVAKVVDHLIATSHKQNVAARTTRATIVYLHSRRNDGMNSRGDLSQDDICYSDYTLYQSVNPPQSEIGHTTVSSCRSHVSTFDSLPNSHFLKHLHSAQRSITWTSIKICVFPLPLDLNSALGLHPT
jgi:hypothetical protein